MMTDEAAYISLADEFDTMGAPLDADGNPIAPDLNDFDEEAVGAAISYANEHNIPYPWDLRSLDIALDYVREINRGPR